MIGADLPSTSPGYEEDRFLVEAAEAVRAFLDRNPSFFFDAEGFLQMAPHFPTVRAELDAIAAAEWRQLDPLTEFRRAAPTIPRYTRYRNVSSFSEVPLIDKRHLRADPASFISSTADRSRLWTYTTSGTSGPSTDVVYDASAQASLLFTTIARIVATARVDVIQVRSLSRVLTFHYTDTRRGRDEVFVIPGPVATLYARMITPSIDQNGAERVRRALLELRPVVISARPEMLRGVARYVSRNALEGYSPACVVSSGSSLSAETRQIAENLFAASVIDAYVLTETGLVASQCPAGSYHISPGIAVEILGADGLDCDDGREGEIVITSVNNGAMPLFRYRSGDRGTAKANCKCGRQGRVLVAIGGRHVPDFTLRDGTRFPPTQFNGIHSLFPILDYRITEIGLGSYLVEVESDSNLVNLAAIRSYIHSLLPSESNVAVERTTFGTSKLQRYRVAHDTARGLRDK